jgi:hypothetical protein
MAQCCTSQADPGSERSRQRGHVASVDLVKGQMRVIPI